MKLRSTLRSPFRSRAVVRQAATEQVAEASLVRASLLAQLIIMALCAARVGIDVLRAARTIEGRLAFALLVVVAISLIVRAVHWMVRSVARTRTNGRPASIAMNLEANDARNR
jgi:hypothetical protein